MWTREEWLETAKLMRHAANHFRLDALPSAWPEWMTKQKRLSMADDFESLANDIEKRKN